jgi:transcriptional regulator with XRE-family HTH domain
MAETGEAPPLLRRLVGDALRGYRTDQGRTLRDVAGAARVSVPYLSEVERGRKEASSEVLAAVCKGLDVRLSDLLEQVRRELLAREPQPDLATRPDLGTRPGTDSRPGLAPRPGQLPRPGVAPQPRRPVQGPKAPVRAGGAGVAAPATAAAPPPAVAPRRWVAVVPVPPARPAPSGPTCQLGATLPVAGPYRSVRPSRHRRRAGRVVGHSRHKVTCALGGGRRAAQIVP